MAPKRSTSAVQVPSSVPSSDPLVLRVIIVTKKAGVAKEVEDALEKAFGRELVLEFEARVEPPKEFTREGAEAPWGEIVFLDGRGADLPQWVRRLERHGRATVVLLDEKSALPEVFTEGLVDGILVSPFRELEVRALLRFVVQAQAWSEVKQVAEETRETLTHLREDMELAERIQKAHLPVRFPDVKGFRVRSRYFAGMRSGGEHLELADSKDGSQLLMLMTDSTSYGLSSAVISTIGRVAARLAVDSLRSPGESATALLTEIRMALKMRDQLSFFLGTLSRKDFVLRYLCLGPCPLFVREMGKGYRSLDSHAGPFSSGGLLPLPTDQSEVRLSRSDRLVLLSDGFQRAIGEIESGLLDPKKVCAWLDQHAPEGKDSESLLNELAYRVRSAVKGEDELPAEDCTVAVFDVDAKILKLA